MKKTKKNPKLLIIVVLVLAVVLVGYFFLRGKGGSKVSDNSSGNGAFSSIADALTKSLSLKCEYTDESGVKSTTYIKNGMIKVVAEGKTKEESGNVIFKDNKAYMWNEEDKEGLVMSFEMDSEDILEGEEGKSSFESYLEALEDYKDYCKGAVISDSEFAVPTEVNFVDFEALMQGGSGYPTGLEE